METWKQYAFIGIITIITLTACEIDNNSAHTHDNGTWRTIQGETCTENGIRELRCISCNELLDTDTIEAHGHEWDEWDQAIQPNYIMANEETRHCIYDSSHIETRSGTPALPITTTSEWNTALAQLDGKIGSYTLTISGNIGIAGTTTSSFGTTVIGSALNITLKGNGKLYLTDQGSIISIGYRQILIIDSEDLVLEGLTNGKNGAIQNNTTAIIDVSGGTLELRNGSISGNTAPNGGGVYLDYNASFTMSGGEISANSASGSYENYGGGVYVRGTFTMNGGKIFGNTGGYGGGGVYVRGTLIMNSGEISDNIASINGGGIQVDGGTFTMNGGNISGNTASSGPYGYGGGVYVRGTFTMNGGEISDNTGSSGGGGVYVTGPTFGGTFNMHSGKIYGNTGYGVANSGIFTLYDGEIFGNDGGVTNSETFTMHSGKISGNTSITGGGGVSNSGEFTMHGGNISGNISISSTYGGGGVCVWRGTFTMNGGEISGNTAINGGGVYVSGPIFESYGTFRIITGIIYGSSEANTSLRNTATNGATLYVGIGSLTQYGILNGSIWSNNVDLDTTDNTIRVVNGEIIP